MLSAQTASELRSEFKRSRDTSSNFKYAQSMRVLETAYGRFIIRFIPRPLDHPHRLTVRLVIGIHLDVHLQATSASS